MEYKLPHFTALLKNIATVDNDTSTDNFKLVQHLNAVSKRYKPPSYSVLYAKVVDLLKLYTEKCAKKPGYFTNKTPTSKRTQQIQFIQQIQSNLKKPTLPPAVKETTKDNEIPVADFTAPEDRGSLSILLGALFHRIERTDKSYKRNGFFSVTSSEGTGLTLAIKDITNINEIGPEKANINILDDLTKLTCYKDYLSFIENRNPPYDYTKIPEFYEDLKKEIRDLEVKTQPMRHLIEHLKFIKSVTESVNSFAPNIVEAVKNMEEPLKELFEADNVYAAQIKDCIPKEARLGEILVNLINDKDCLELDEVYPVDEDDDDLDEEQLKAKQILLKNERIQSGVNEYIKRLITRVDSYCSYAALGAYGFCLTQLKDDSPLAIVLNAAIMSPDNRFLNDQLRLKRAYLSLTLLLEQGESFGKTINYNTWTSRENFSTKLNAKCIKLEAKTQEEPVSQSALAMN